MYANFFEIPTAIVLGFLYLLLGSNPPLHVNSPQMICKILQVLL